MLSSKSDSTWKQFCSEKSFVYLQASSIHIKIVSHIISSTIYSIKWAHDVNGLLDPTDNAFKDTVSSDILIELCDIYISSESLLEVRDLCMINISKCQSKADDVTRHSSAEMAGSITDSQSAICVSCVTDSRDLSLVSQSPLENNEDPVVGKLVSLKTRCLYQCIVARASWNAQVHVTNEAINEIMNVLEAQCKTIE
ncbi:hypothetical protein KUTeg_002494 [Tegillarca granosa]|uniref:Uncharacterized protein n=1 Tax=Tegillarca granosa TaxID=220873 RepID=A0ABQ9FY22_TEGGR|nr:hypothetical protein KUTeg_002494 [Tegillarca granosa]